MAGQLAEQIDQHSMGAIEIWQHDNAADDLEAIGMAVDYLRKLLA